MATVLTTAQKNARSLSFGSEQAARPHSLPRELEDLRNDVEDAFVALESGANIPMLVAASGAIGNGGGTASVVLVGENLLAGRVQASATVSGIDFTAVLPGSAGNDISISIVNPGAINQNLAVTEDLGTKVVTISLATDGAGDLDAANNAAADIVTAVNSDSTLVNAEQVGAPAGAVSSGSLEGGTGRGMSVKVVTDSGSHDVVPAVVSNTSITLPDGESGGGTQGSIAGVYLVSHTAKSNVLNFVVTA